MSRPERVGVVFDMDGVLILSAPAHWAAWRDVAWAHGLELTREAFFGTNGMANPDIVRTLWGEVDDGIVRRIADAKERAFRANIARQVPLAPGCVELLGALRREGIPLALGSSAPEANVDHVLDHGSLREWFDAVVHSGMVARGKPAPDIFLAAAERLGLAPSQCLVVEDAPNGVRAGVAAGMRVLGISSNHAPEELLEVGAVQVVPELASVTPALVRQHLDFTA
ncbi:MAG: Beta-phosphoglucomutase [Planctomycetota bacterium]|jgi:beta-phosphoglucomutase family hydrolase